MREILFRAKDIKRGDWIEGFYFKIKRSVIKYKSKEFEDVDTHNIVKDTHEDYEYEDTIAIDPGTLGQYTGKDDLNGTKIFEGDKVKFTATVLGEEDFEGIVKMIEGAWLIENYSETDAITLYQECSPVEVIGNIHDNTNY